MFPLLLAVGALGLAGYGVKMGVDAKDDFEDADGIMRAAEAQLEDARDRVEGARAATQILLEGLGRERLRIEAETITDFLRAYRRVNLVNFKELEIGRTKVESIQSAIADMEVSSLRAVEIVSIGVEALGTGAAAALGAGWLAGTVGFASTGVAIEGLVGVAATNATLAWLGGGALSAGGFGMAGGMALLGGLVAGPALTVVGFAAASQAEEALTNAHEYDANVDVICEKLDAGIAILKKSQKRVTEVTNGLHALEDRLIEEIESFGQLSGRAKTVKYEDLSADARGHFDAMVVLAIALTEVLRVNLFKEDGTLNPAAKKAITSSKAALGPTRVKA